MTETIETLKNGHGSLPMVDISKLPTGPGLIAPSTLYLKAYVKDFNRNVIDAYRRGVAELTVTGG